MVLANSEVDHAMLQGANSVDEQRAAEVAGSGHRLQRNRETDRWRDGQVIWSGIETGGADAGEQRFSIVAGWFRLASISSHQINR